MVGDPVWICRPEDGGVQRGPFIVSESILRGATWVYRLCYENGSSWGDGIEVSEEYLTLVIE